ncbi:MAG: hypothetical protein NXI10_05475 [bacterium]|nr:hypothetical protein [bacterium]
MRKFLIHTIELRKPQAKKSFQVKLPWTAKQVVGLHIDIQPNFHAPMDQLIADGFVEVGSIWLRLSGNRDVFYADTLGFPYARKKFDPTILPQGFIGRDDWWLTGTQFSFLKMTVPVESTLIEGYYEDQHENQRVDYNVKLYLELEINDRGSSI